MNSQQKQFCDEYLIDLNGTKAAIRAGYDPNTARSYASQLLDREDIIEYISEKQRKVSEKLDWSYEKVLNNFATVYERCMQGEPVLDHEGNPTGEWKFEPMAALKANENIGKHIGFYERDNKQKQPSTILLSIDPLHLDDSSNDSITQDSGTSQKD